MGWLNTEKPPGKYDASYLRSFVERLRTAVNFLDSNNFPNGLSGIILNDKSVSIGKLYGMTWRLPLLSLATPHTTTSTTLTNVGGLTNWDTSHFFASKVKLTLCATINVANASETVTLELHGADGKLTEVTHTGDTSLTHCVSTSFDAPSTSQTLLLKFKTSNATHAVSVVNAYLVVAIK